MGWVCVCGGVGVGGGGGVHNSGIVIGCKESEGAMAELLMAIS